MARKECTKMVEGDKLRLSHNNGCLPESPDENAKNNIKRASDLLVSVSAPAEMHKAKIIDLAFAASEELRVMAQEGEPLWLFNVDKGSEVLNVAEYKRRFPNLNGNKEHEPDNVHVSPYTTENVDYEASRATGVVFRNPICLVNLLVDAHRWSAVFSNMVSKAITLAVLYEGPQANPDGTLLVMVAEFHVPSPLVKTCEMYFARYSKRIDMNTWVVADVSLETIFPSPVVTCRRKPSGCIIQALQDELSAVTWVEHNTESNGVVNYVLGGLFKSGFAFSAKRWISSLERQCDRIATLEAQNDSLNCLSNNTKGLGAARNGLLKLAERMVRQFNFNLFSNVESVWIPLPIPGAEEILIKTSINLNDPQIACGVAVTIATSVWLPVNQNDIFNFLRTDYNRNKWDILSHGLQIQDIMHISSARNSTDCVSVVSIEPSSTKPSITYLQESFSDSIMYYLVYAPIDLPAMHHILQGGSMDAVAILPSGFAVLPGGLPAENAATENSILTIGFQIMDEELTTPEELPPQSVFTAYRLIKETVSRIWTALLPKI